MRTQVYYLVLMLKEDLINLIIEEEKQIRLCPTSGEKSDRTNNVLQIKIASQIPELQADIYINVKNFINHYIGSLEEKQFNYDEFDVDKIFNYIKLFEVEQKCALLNFTIRHLKSIGFNEKVQSFENELRKCELLKEWKSVNPKNIFRVIYLATVYNSITILFAILLCITMKIVVYLPAPAKWMVLYDVHYDNLSNNKILNHVGNVLLSIFEVKENPSFADPVNFRGAVLFVIGKCFFILIVINILIDQLKSRFKF